MADTISMVGLALIAAAWAVQAWHSYGMKVKYAVPARPEFTPTFLSLYLLGVLFLVYSAYRAGDHAASGLNAAIILLSMLSFALAGKGGKKK